uniref:Cytochrome c oxidase assembly protein COX20, mitochondrial n=1 Tax=Geotrypetes seraphini TaxID=260995 RepID=A0A6P8Q3Q1_GEOSA|nr:cytochrome c oxidase assembly protein COX20, mitochondrial [Geotrypetes seraphini]XP_033794599.1 cytochrome c oxidase assembly protein COX20, mitochondrial [Geotrypetes seraphini]XP_033794600.1 cytochrome c oxidase assembly protein COX20, mitochondrial [Geotrypetes seraphini]XP_033794601.1 cytochrome c oxidase assembly protein COX20, mitochondrial [Geotrypetes seraphini]XP_033794602.1 cytochrome c oxidase assembly protein COX20, mitochondrial [Geotrypetes seraphini]
MASGQSVERQPEISDSSLSESGLLESTESFKLLGILDVKKVPCARESVLYGAAGSVVAGLGHFLATSKVRRSCDFGVGGFLLTTLGCWLYCRYNHAKLRLQQKMIRKGMKNKILYEGTSLDPDRRQKDDNQGNN